MPMRLKGSCRCGAVRFEVDSHTPYPYQLCYCSICRKTAGGGGFAINIMGVADSLSVEGRDALALYRAEIDGETSTGQRHACARCATALWLFDESWPDLIHPLASAVDTPLPRPPERVHLMLADKPDWGRPRSGRTTGPSTATRRSRSRTGTGPAGFGSIEHRRAGRRPDRRLGRLSALPKTLARASVQGRHESDVRSATEAVEQRSEEVPRGAVVGEVVGQQADRPAVLPGLRHQGA